MDVLDNANMERIRKYLDINEDYEFKARKNSGYWVLWITDGFAPKFQETAPTFAEALKQLSHSLYIYLSNTYKSPGVDSNERGSKD